MISIIYDFLQIINDILYAHIYRTCITAHISHIHQAHTSHMHSAHIVLANMKSVKSGSTTASALYTCVCISIRRNRQTYPHPPTSGLPQVEENADSAWDNRE